MRAEVEATYPYTLNTQPLTTNDEDKWSIISADENFDPIPQFVYLGDSIEDGLFAWIQIGINGSADYTDNEYYGVGMLNSFLPLQSKAPGTTRPQHEPPAPVVSSIRVKCTIDG